MIGRLRGAYGEGPLHLVGHLAFFAITAYVVVQLADAPSALTILLWIVGAALIHDLVLVPVYAAADRALRGALPRLRTPIVNHVRFVGVVSGTLLIVWFPVMFGKADGNIERNAGLTPDDYLIRWLAVTAGLAVLSTLAYAARALRAGRVGRVEERDDAVGPAADEDAPRA